MTTLLTVLHVIVCLFLMLTVLLQQGKGGGMGSAFGGGNAATVFGGSGASSFLRRLTAGAVTVFMLDSMTLAFLASRNSGDALEKFGAQEQQRAKEKEASRNAAHKLSGSGAVAPGAQGSAAGSAIMFGSGANATQPPLPEDQESMGSATGSAPAVPAADKPTAEGSAGSVTAPKATDVPPAPKPATPAPKTMAPAAPKATETKPAETKPAETKPAETKPAETDTQPAPAPAPTAPSSPTP